MSRRGELGSVRWIGAALAPAAVTLALLAPAPSAPFPPAGERSIAAPAVERTSAAAVDINALDAEALATLLPGIGQAYADRIVTHRRLFGPIASSDQLRQLGIPDATVKRVAPLVRFGP